MLNTWMYHPGGYASLTGQSGVTYFVAPTNQVHQFVSSRKMEHLKKDRKIEHQKYDIYYAVELSRKQKKRWEQQEHT